ncbi:hypothetical protein PV08_00158 [Exophiala spinifera]|uniref:Nephrocystin 3-like N-terminal domain-containing protein n=1 Tax=Exophiala spinifera TaxID=91928 RepID=A0A0D2BLY3_9EURO|nr:uncharacterized protein PV08_00158 [Exophiala spinifera]KIW19585.1 hypothetical protein PV08_00158 [Exophiala spinifera]
MSSMVEQLHTSRQSTDIIAHHFCFSDNDDSLKARNVVGSLARQILEEWLQNAEADELRALHRKTSDVDSAEITDIISNLLLPNVSYYILLDGIDKCPPNEAQEVVACLLKLCQRHRNLKLS